MIATLRVSPIGYNIAMNNMLAEIRSYCFVNQIELEIEEIKVSFFRKQAHIKVSGEVENIKNIGKWLEKLESEQ